MNQVRRRAEPDVIVERGEVRDDPGAGPPPEPDAGSPPEQDAAPPPEPDVIVEMRHITKRFPGVVANDDIDLSIRRGEIFALLGENGAGKSTLMSMLFGMYEPDEGEILLRGKRVRIASPSEAVALDIGMVHQHFKLVSNYTVTENIILGKEPVRRLFGLLPLVDRKEADRRVRELSARYRFDLEPTAVIEDLGVSAQQRVEILKMLYREAEILIFDEPTAMLTPQEIEALLAIVRALRDAGKTIILITHKLEEIKQVADRCAVLNSGRLVEVFDVATTSTRLMAQRMVGREVDFEISKRPARFGEVVLDVRGLTVHDEQKVARVKGLSFQVHGGEVFAVAGVAGNGQVELADALAGLLPTRQGTVVLKGEDITRSSVRRRTVKGVAYIPEDRHGVGLILDFPVADNLASKSYFRPPFSKGPLLRQAEFKSHATEVIERYDIRCGKGPMTLVRSMSGGNQQKVIVAREIDQGADLVIFVQPTRGLDIGATLGIRNRIIAERDAGKAVLLISLELDEVLSCADTIGVLYNGEMTKVAPASELGLGEVGEYMMGVRR
ncbi:MAG: ABC transporter ATP-binding protein [Coriobacteriales bacterium]|jgi:simple sugar transport system ATP-binding protein|nr:ABC transporter ATP-binding protein [Coriobacteriales bacterium]